MESEPFRVSVYWDTDEECKYVSNVLESVSPGHTYVYRGITDGWVTDEKLQELRRQGLTVILTGVTPPHPSTDTAAQIAASPVETSSPRESNDGGDNGQAPDTVGVVINSAAVSSRSTDIGASTLLRRAKYFDPQLQDQLQQLQQKIPDAASAKHRDMYMVRLKETMRPEWQAELKTLGEICSYRYPNICQMFIAEENLDRVSKLPYVSNIRRYGLANTVTTDLLDVLSKAENADEEAVDAQLMSDGADVTASSPLMKMEVVVHSPEDLDKVKESIESHPQTSIISQSSDTIRFEAPLDKTFIAQFGNMPEVKSISSYNPSSIFVDRVRSLAGIDSLTPNPSGIGNKMGTWTGQGVIIGILDSGIDETHPDFSQMIKDGVIKVDQIPGANASDQVGHGTHVAGIISGSGLSSEGDKGERPLRGIAPDAQLVVIGITDNQGIPQLDQFVDLGELLEKATSKGATILNLSWGGAIGGSYDHGSASVDKFIYNHPEILVVVAAGNSGEEDASGNLRFNTVGTPASAKNALTVGASATDRVEEAFKIPWGVFRHPKFPLPAASERLVSGDPDLPAAISSRGPTDYDSIKPDVLAPGTFILSTRISKDRKSIGNIFFWREFDQFENRYAFLGGSSMATPVVTGAAAIVKQYLREVRQQEHPSAALMKAILLASVRRLPSTKSPDLDKVIGYPDFDQGFGRVDLATILPTKDSPAGRKLLFVDVPNDSPDALQSRPPLESARKASCTYKITVPPESVEDLRIVLAYTDYPGNYVQNNLQLEVRGPERNFVGNEGHFYRKDPNFDDKSSDGVPYDKRNNVEQVRVDSPVAGEYRIRVIAQNTPYPPQGYALCVCGEISTELEAIV